MCYTSEERMFRIFLSVGISKEKSFGGRRSPWRSPRPPPRRDRVHSPHKEFVTGCCVSDADRGSRQRRPCARSHLQNIRTFEGRWLRTVSPNHPEGSWRAQEPSISAGVWGGGCRYWSTPKTTPGSGLCRATGRAGSGCSPAASPGACPFCCVRTWGAEAGRTPRGACPCWEGGVAGRPSREDERVSRVGHRGAGTHSLRPFLHLP